MSVPHILPHKEDYCPILLCFCWLCTVTTALPSRFGKYFALTQTAESQPESGQRPGISFSMTSHEDHDPPVTFARYGPDLSGHLRILPLFSLLL